jgi:hypothetical protein
MPLGDIHGNFGEAVSRNPIMRQPMRIDCERRERPEPLDVLAKINPQPPRRTERRAITRKRVFVHDASLEAQADAAT